MTHPVYPEVSIIPKDGGSRSDGDSDAATKSATVRLQTGPAEERGKQSCSYSSSALWRRRAGIRTAAEPGWRRVLPGDGCLVRGADGAKEGSAMLKRAECEHA